MRILTLLLLLVGFALASNMDLNDELQAEAIYIDNYCNGYWPDYKNLKPDCIGERK